MLLLTLLIVIYLLVYVSSSIFYVQVALNFRKLCPYFRGKHTLEEMMFQTQLKREEVRLVLSNYDEILVECTHPIE